MEVEVNVVPCVVYKDCVSCSWLCTSDKFNQSELKELISGNFG